MADVSVAILGLGRLGASVGLALQRHNEAGEHNFKITGYDTSPENVKTAKKINAVHEIQNHPDNAVRGKDIVVMAMPYGEVLTAYDLINPDLRSGSVILDMSTLKRRSLDWGKANLGEDIHMICITPIINPKYLYDGTDDPRRATSDYFDKGTMMVMPSVTAIKEAINLAADFSTVLGQTPQFFDPDEHDALLSSTEALPQVLGLIYFNVMRLSEGWTDSQRLFNPSAGMLSRVLFDTHPDDLFPFLRDSREQLIHQLDEMIFQLREMRNVLANDDKDSLAGTIETASKTYEGWINRRHNNRWQDDDKLQDGPTFGSLMGNMFGSFVTNRMGGRDKKDEN